MNDQTTIISDRPVLEERFEVINLLGEGAGSAVFHVIDRAQGRKEVALKILTNSDAFDSHTIARFLEEIRICQGLRHEHIIEAYDFIELQDSIAFTMEYVNGRDLSKVVDHNPLEFDRIERYLDQTLQALEALHKEQIIHRDIKLENILVSKADEIKLTDLGLLKHLNTERGLTKTGILLGTAQYMPPEYVKEGKYDNRGDLYALGIVLWEMIEGTRRLGHLNGNQVIEQLLKDKFKAPEVTRPNVPGKLLYIMKRALNVSPAKRFQSAAEMRQVLNSSNEDAFDENGVKLAPKIKITRVEGKLGGATGPTVIDYTEANSKSVYGIAFVALILGALAWFLLGQ